MRPLLAALLLTPATALAGTVTISVGTTQETVQVEPGEVHTHAFTVGRFPVRLITLQERASDGTWRWDFRLERTHLGRDQLLLHPRITTGPGVDGHIEADSRLGPVRIHCRD